MHKIFTRQLESNDKSYDCIVDTVAELTTDPALLALGSYSRALVLNTDVGADADISVLIKRPDGTWKVVA